jgi:hypothetical protein
VVVATIHDGQVDGCATNAMLRMSEIGGMEIFATNGWDGWEKGNQPMRRALEISRAASIKAWRIRKLQGESRETMAAQVRAAWRTRLSKTVVKRVAQRIDPAVRITPPRSGYRFRVYQFSDGSKLRTRGSGYHFLMVGGG